MATSPWRPTPCSSIRPAYAVSCFGFTPRCRGTPGRRASWWPARSQPQIAPVLHGRLGIYRLRSNKIQMAVNPLDVVVICFARSESWLESDILDDAPDIHRRPITIVRELDVGFLTAGHDPP